MKGHLKACYQSVPIFVTKCPHACQECRYTYWSWSAFLLRVTKLMQLKKPWPFTVHHHLQ